MKYDKEDLDFLEDIDEVKEFVDFNDKVLKYVFLMYYYYSPYYRLQF